MSHCGRVRDAHGPAELYPVSEDEDLSPIVAIDDDIYDAIDDAFEIARERCNRAAGAGRQSGNIAGQLMQRQA